MSVGMHHEAAWKQVRSSHCVRSKLKNKSQKLIHRLGMLQVHQLPVATDDAFADHFRSPALLGHLIGIECLCCTRTAIGSMRAFKAGMETGVSVSAITIAIAR